MTWQTISGGALLASEFALNWLIQSTVLLAVGLVAGRLLRPAGAAVQSAAYRATLAAVLACPVASAALLGAGVDGVRLRPPAAGSPIIAPASASPAVGSSPGPIAGPMPAISRRPPVPRGGAATAAPPPAGRTGDGSGRRSP